MSAQLYPQQQAAARRARAKIVSVTSPIGGWNTRDSVDQMEPTDAVVLDNMVPRVGKVEARKGYSTFITGAAATLGGSWTDDVIETLISFTSGTAEYMLACFDGGIARMDTGTPIEVKVRGTYTVDRWQHTVFADSAAPGTPKVVAVNGTDTPWTWDGTTHAAWAPTGVTPANVIHIASFKNRLIAVEKNSRDFWYGGLGAIAGAFTRFPLSGIRGAQGNLLFTAAMTRDTGTGPDDFFVAVTSEGQVIIYAGTDPSDATAWQLVGVYQIPRPINSRRAYCNLFGDIVIATELDYVFLNQALQESGAVLLNASKLSGAMQQAKAKYGSNYGWQLIVSAADGVLISQIPKTDGAAQSEQHVVSLQTAASCRFTGWDQIRTYCVHGGQLYGAGAGEVFTMLSGYADDADGANSRIELCAQSAWTDFGSSEIKHVRATRPRLRAQGPPSYASAIGVDFVDPVVAAVPSTGQAGSVTLWGDAAGATTLWGDTAATTTYWAGTSTATTSASREWRLNAARGIDFGFAIAIDLRDQAIEWLATEYKIELAGRF